jgi:hypothetical protein
VGNLEIAHLRLLLVREFALGIATIFLRSLAHRTRAKMVDKVRLYFEQKHLEASLSYELDTFDRTFLFTSCLSDILIALSR